MCRDQLRIPHDLTIFFFIIIDFSYKYFVSIYIHLSINKFDNSNFFKGPFKKMINLLV